MSEQPRWIAGEESSCMLKWMEHLHAEATKLFEEDGTHGSMLFLFSKEEGLVSVDLVPPNVGPDQLDETIIDAVNGHDLYGVIVIGEIWMYCFTNEKDHTLFQLLDGEMKVSDLNDNDKKEALMLRMENRDGDCVVYLDDIVRDENSSALKGSKILRNASRKWFVTQPGLV